MSRPERQEVCNVCPWLRKNHNKPATPRPPGYKVDEESGDYVDDWFGDENRARLWEGLRDGEAMSCHASDPVQWENLDQSKPREICAGMLLLVKKELDVFEEVIVSMPGASPAKTYRAYKKLRPGGMTRDGLERWAVNLTFPCILGGLADVIPKVVPDVDVAR